MKASPFSQRSTILAFGLHSDTTSFRASVPKGSKNLSVTFPILVWTTMLVQAQSPKHILNTITLRAYIYQNIKKPMLSYLNSIQKRIQKKNFHRKWSRQIVLYSEYKPPLQPTTDKATQLKPDTKFHKFLHLKNCHHSQYEQLWHIKSRFSKSVITINFNTI